MPVRLSVFRLLALRVSAARPCWCRSRCHSHHLVSFLPILPVGLFCSVHVVYLSGVACFSFSVTAHETLTEFRTISYLYQYR